MDSVCNAAARALGIGDPLGALKLVALRDDAPALALRGIAMAQLGDLDRAKDLLRRAARAFGPREALARARTELARAEVLLSARDLEVAGQERTLARARATLELHGDRVNALHARLLAIRRQLLIGELDGAERGLAELGLEAAPAHLAAIAELCAGELALRRIRTQDARRAFERGARAAERTRIPALRREIELAGSALELAAARLVRDGGERSVRLSEVEELFASDDLVVDSCRRVLRHRSRRIELARRPVLFALALALAETWPDGASRETLIARAFGARRSNASHRARLRVEIGRLRRELGDLAGLGATPAGFALITRRARHVSVLLPPIDGAGAALLALLGDGQAWSTSALALALGRSQRTVQRVLGELLAASRVRCIGKARARRWLAPPVAGFTTTLLLPAAFGAG
jgi:hypothetical protein